MKRKTHVAVVESHNLRIPIFLRTDVKNGTVYSGYYFVQTINGQRKQTRCSSLEEAKSRAKQLIEYLTKDRRESRVLSDTEYADYSAALQILRNHPNFTLAAVVAEWSAASKIVGEGSIVVACEAQKKTDERQSGFKPSSVKSVYDEFMAQLEANDASNRYLEDCRSRMRRLAEAFNGYIHNVSAKLLSDWMNGLSVSVRTRRNFRTAAVTLWKYAKERGYLPRNLETEAELVPALSRLKSGKKDAEIGIYKPEEFAKILACSPDFLLASFAIGGFAGLRSAEVHRLVWGDIHDTHIVVRANNAKTGSRRIVPVLPALKFWLGKVEKGEPKERLCARFSHENGLARAQSLAIERAGVAPVHNGLRHSFCTYRLAEVQDAAKVALEAGNSPQMLFKHYRALATADRATDWFTIGIGRPRLPRRKAVGRRKSVRRQ